jgi:hypothetical protein
MNLKKDRAYMVQFDIPWLLTEINLYLDFYFLINHRKFSLGCPMVHANQGKCRLLLPPP